MANFKKKMIPISLCVSIVLASQSFAQETATEEKVGETTVLETIQVAGGGNPK